MLIGFVFAYGMLVGAIGILILIAGLSVSGMKD